MIPEIRKTITVNAVPNKAFAVFTRDIGKWWPFAGHSISETNGSTARSVVITPEIGGPLTEFSNDGNEYVWGRIKTWQPGEKLVFSWLMGIAEEDSSEVEVTFAAEGAGCRVTLIHRNWDGYGEGAKEKRDNYDSGWDFVFGECYAAACV